MPEKPTQDLLGGIALFLLALWVVFFLDRLLPLERLGLVPRSAAGLVGIVTMPFLHKDLAHLAANSVPLTVLLVLLAVSGGRTLSITVSIALIGGVLLWIFGRSANHIGASGLVFGLAAYLIAAAWYAKTLLALIIAIVTLILYGGVLMSGVLPFSAGISWDGHLFGAIAGVIVAATAIARAPMTQN